MKFKYALLITVGLTCFSTHSFAEISPEVLDIVKQTANQGGVEAQEALGELYQNGGYGIKKDPFEAKGWYEKAIDQGNTSAMVNLSNMYQAGDGVRQDYAKSKELLEKAANQGNTEAQYNLGMIYLKGQGVAKNPSKAMVWYKKAADQGNGSALNAIGVIYEYGKGVPKNKIKAKDYYKQACLHKEAKGCENYKDLNNK